MPPPASHHVTANNLRLHYLEAGEGTPILLLHGFPTSSHLYRNILPTLAKTHRAIALDLPGYGLSDKPLDVTYGFDFYADTVDGFLDALGIEDTHLCVHDLGGPVGVYWALRRPERVQKLVVLNTLVYPETSWAVKLFLLALRVPFLRDYIVSPKGIVAAMKLGVVNKARLNRAILTPYAAPFEDRAAQKALIKAGSGLSLRGLAKIARELPTWHPPLRLIYGQNDRILPDIAKTMSRIQKSHPAAELTALPNCGHFLQEDEPEQLARLMAEFFNRDSDQPSKLATPAPEPGAITATSEPPTSTDVIEAFNAFTRNDLDVPPAAVTPCTYNSFPTNIQELMGLIPDAHETFFDHAAGPDFTTLKFETPHRRNVQNFDPTADMYLLPSASPAGLKAQSTSQSYFKARHIEVIQVTGTDNRQDLNIAFQIALDPQSNLLFTFITALSD